MLRYLWMKCLPANMAACLATRTYRTNLDILAGVADRTQELYVQPRVHAVETQIPNPITPQQPGFLA
nr:hypothetical transcript [Hymenolepis microstoma]CUU99350.1 hypothetical transcript [Hymenolepis microstoma]